VSRVATEASPKDEFPEKTTRLAKRDDVTAFVTDTPTNATTNAANLAADDFCAAMAYSVHARAATIDLVATAQVTNLDREEKPEAHEERAEQKTEAHRQSTKIDKPQEYPHTHPDTDHARRAPIH